MNKKIYTQYKKKSLLDPRAKLLLVFMEAVLVLASAGGERLFWFRAVFTVLPFLLLITAKRHKNCIIGLIVIAIIYILEALTFPHMRGVPANIMLIVIMIVRRFLPAYLTGVYVINTTTVSEFKAAMDKLHMPDALTIPMCVMFRFFPTMMRILEYRIVPMITCTAKIGEELSASALTRGLSRQKKRTNICHIGFDWFDWIFFLLVAAMLIYWGLGVFA